jgi:hypothetical protein
MAGTAAGGVKRGLSSAGHVPRGVHTVLARMSLFLSLENVIVLVQVPVERPAPLFTGSQRICFMFCTGAEAGKTADAHEG